MGIYFIHILNHIHIIIREPNRWLKNKFNKDLKSVLNYCKLRPLKNKHRIMGYFNKLWSIRGVVFIYQFIPISIITLFVIFAWITSNYYNYQAFEKRQEQFIIENNKQKLYAEVNRIIELLDFSRKKLDNDSMAQERVLDYITKRKFNYSGYIFINNTNGKALVFEGERVENKFINSLVDASGRNIYKMELEACSQESGDFIEYSFRKIGDTIAYPKIAYIKLYSDFNWMIGGGNYLDEVHVKVVDYLSYFWQKLLRQTLFLFLILVITFITLYYYSSRVSNRYSNMINNVQEYFELKIQGDVVDKIDDNKIIIKELNELYFTLDAAIERKNILEKEQKKYFLLLEQTVKERTADLENRTIELSKKNSEMERINDLFVDREFRIKELKEKIIQLEQEIHLLNHKLD